MLFISAKGLRQGGQGRAGRNGADWHLHTLKVVVIPLLEVGSHALHRFSVAKHFDAVDVLVRFEEVALLGRTRGLVELVLQNERDFCIQQARRVLKVCAHDWNMDSSRHNRPDSVARAGWSSGAGRHRNRA